MPELKICLIQSDLYWEDPLRNLDHFSEVLNRMTEPADLILLPEMFSTGFSIHPGHAETMDGPSVQFMKAMARTKDAVICGSRTIRENDSFYNRLICFYPDGTFLKYDKRHLFCLSDESSVFTAGSEKQILTVKGFKILPLICYDLRFPVWCKNRFDGQAFDYDLLLYVANWPESRAHVWRTLLMARAIENQAWVAGVNRIGRDGAGTNHVGESLVIDPKGRILAEAPHGEAAILTAVLPFEELEAFRRSFPAGRDWDQFTIEI